MKEDRLGLVKLAQQHAEPLASSGCCMACAQNSGHTLVE